MTDQYPTPETEVPRGDHAAGRCPYCDRPFRTTRLKKLHVGEIHADESTDEEWATYEDAREAERDDLFTYHFRVVITLGVTYAIMVLVLMVLLGGKV
ncbi:hypothetical protein ACKVMT_06050 [Halobacteriales archaeon Cl-PHB]